MQQHEDQERVKREAERKDDAKWKADREKRAEDWRAETAKEYGNTLDLPAARTELNLHNDRMARLNRVLDIAEDKKDTTLASHCKQVMQKEVARDSRVMAALKAQGGAR